MLFIPQYTEEKQITSGTFAEIAFNITRTRKKRTSASVKRQDQFFYDMKNNARLRVNLNVSKLMLKFVLNILFHDY